MINGKDIKKVINDTKKYFILTPPSHNIIKPLLAINTEVPKSGCDKTKMMGIIIIVRANEILINEFTFSIFIRW